MNNSITTLTEEQVQARLDEIHNELIEIRHLKQCNRVTPEDIEDVSDNYQYNLEWNYLIDELNSEAADLIRMRNTFHEYDEND